MVPCPYAAQSTLTTKVDPVVELPLSHQAVCAGEVGFRCFMHRKECSLPDGTRCTAQCRHTSCLGAAPYLSNVAVKLRQSGHRDSLQVERHM